MRYAPITFINKSPKTGKIICLCIKPAHISAGLLSQINNVFNGIEAQNMRVAAIGISLPLLQIFYSRFGKTACDFTRQSFRQCHNYNDGDVAGQIWAADIIISHMLNIDQITYYVFSNGFSVPYATHRHNIDSIILPE